MPTNHSYDMGCSSWSGCMAFGTIRPIALSPLSRIALSGDLPLVSLGPVRVLDARLSTRGIPRALSLACTSFAGTLGAGLSRHCEREDHHHLTRFYPLSTLL